MVNERRLRFSERKALAETGSLGDLQTEPTSALRAAIHLYLQHRRTGINTTVLNAYDASVADQLGRHFGSSDITKALQRPTTDEFLDVIEIVCEEAIKPRGYRVMHKGSYSGRTSSVAPTFEADVNAMFDRHRFGYRLEDGLIRPISSPLLDAEIVGPALLAVARPGWEQVQRSYQAALNHQRRFDEHALALTAATAAVEAALKAAGYSGATLGDLARSFRQSPVAAGYSPKVVENLVELLEQLMAWRSHSGSAHGKPPGSPDPPEELVALAIHWAGSFISYLGAATS